MSLFEKLSRAHQGGPRLDRGEPIQQTLEEAYDIQKKLVEVESLNGNQLKGYKISLTSQETQNLFGATNPLYGALTEDSLVEDEILLDKLSEPLIEVELMFLIDQDIEPNDHEPTILEKTRIAPGIEVPDSRYENWFPHLSLTQIVADRAVAGKVVVGEPIAGVTVERLNSIEVSVQHNHKLIATGHSSEVLGNPVYAVKWLVEELAQTDQYLRKGMVVSSGTFIMPKKLEKGVYTVDFETIGSIKLKVS